MQTPLPAPTASGAFNKTPFPHLLVYALERRLSGTFQLSRGMNTVATMLVVGGCPAKVRTHEPVHFLGNIMLELGMITPQQLQMSFDEQQRNPRLQGQILLEAGVVDGAILDAGLRAQVDRKVEHLFSFSSDTMFAYYDNIDLLSGFGGPPTPIDPFPVLWRGVRETPAWEHVDATLRRIGTAMLRASSAAQFERFAFGQPELQVATVLRERPLRVLDITNAVGPSVGQLLAYFMMIMKQVDLVEAAQPAAQRPAVPPPPPAPAPAPPPPAPAAPSPPVVAEPISAPAPIPPSGQAFARVQLHKATPRQPFVVEEVVIASSGRDERTSSPAVVASVGAFGRVSEPPMAPAAGGALDIGSMISHTIEQSAPPPSMSSPPPGGSMPPPSIPPQSGQASQAPAGSQSLAPPPAMPSDAPPAAPLTAEQTTLKQRIVDRAEQITAQDYFKMLGLERNAKPEEVQSAFFALAKVWHPDRLPPALIDVKDACSKVFTHLTEAHATLMDSVKRQEYMTLLRDGGATPDDQAQIMSILEAATEFQKAEVLLKRNPTDPQAYEIIKRCVAMDGTQADYLATLAWLDAQKPEWQSREKTLEKCVLLDRCVLLNPYCERAYFYRGLLYKRAEEPLKALKDFKKAAELNPRNLDAMREVRLHKMRGGVPSKPPPGAPSGPPRGTKPGKPVKPEPEGLGSLFGKLFKK